MKDSLTHLIAAPSRLVLLLALLVLSCSVSTDSELNVESKEQALVDCTGGYTDVNSICALRKQMMNASGASCVKLEPGVYTVAKSDIDGSSPSSCGTALPEDKHVFFRAMGDNRVFNFSGATIKMPITLLSEDEWKMESDRGASVWMLDGDNITFKGGTFEATYPSGLSFISNQEVTNFIAYNHVFSDPSLRPATALVHMIVKGNSNSLIGTTLKVRGSHPYGYGSLYGKGSDSAVGGNNLRKHAGILITGDNCTLDVVTVDQAAFGHAIVMQGNADGTTIDRCRVTGRLRHGKDILAEGYTSWPANFCYQRYDTFRQRGSAIQPDEWYPLTEDGIRMYKDTCDDTESACDEDQKVDTLDATIKNTVVQRARVGIATFGSAGKVLVENVDVRQCEIGYTPPTESSKSTIKNSTGDATVGPLLDLRSGSKIAEVDLRLVDRGTPAGNHNLAEIIGDNHRIAIGGDRPPWGAAHPIKIGSGGNATAVKLVNETQIPVELTAGTSLSAVWGTTTSDGGTSNSAYQVGEWKFHAVGTSANKRLEFRHLGWADGEVPWTQWNGASTADWDGACLFHLGDFVLGFAGCNQFTTRSWTFTPEGRLKYSISLGFTNGACLYRNEQTKFLEFRDCVTGDDGNDWTMSSEGKIRYSAFADDFVGGACLGYVGDEKFGLRPCGVSAPPATCNETSCCVNADCEAPQLVASTAIAAGDPLANAGACTPGWEQQKWEFSHEGGRSPLKWRSIQDSWELGDGREEDLEDMDFLRDSGGRLSLGSNSQDWIVEVLTAPIANADGQKTFRVKFKRNDTCLEYVGGGQVGLVTCTSESWIYRYDEQLQWGNTAGGWSGDKCFHYLGDGEFGLALCGNRQARHDYCEDTLNLTDCPSNTWY